MSSLMRLMVGAKVARQIRTPGVPVDVPLRLIIGMAALGMIVGAAITPDKSQDRELAHPGATVAAVSVMDDGKKR